MSSRSRHGSNPTEKVLVMAQTAPGGVVRWRDVRDAYVSGSKAAQRWERMGDTYHHMSISQLLKRHFTKVVGTDGYYVLNHLITGGYDLDVVVEHCRWEGF